MKGGHQSRVHPVHSSSTIDLTVGDVRVLPAERETTWTNLRYYQTDEVWQHEKCAQLGLRLHMQIILKLVAPMYFLNCPNTDGNCLFRGFSQIITGSPGQHYAVRMCIY